LPDIVLVQPPNPYLLDPTTRWPLGLSYLEAVLLKAGAKVAVADLRDKEIDLSLIPEALIIGITATTGEIGMAKELAHLIKQRNYNTFTVIGGSHASYLPEDCAQYFDLVVIGEAEYDINQFLQQRYFGTRYTKSPLDLDTLPFPIRHPFSFSNTLFEGAGYGKGPMTTSIITSRGCPYTCAYCQEKPRPVRFRSPENVVEEIKEIQSKWDYHHFRFEDDNFTLKPERVFEICRLLEPLKVYWRCHSRSDLFNRDMARAMRLAGCNEVGFGVESADQRVLDIVNKKETIKQHIRAIRIAEDSGIRTKAFFMTGLPGETDEIVGLTKSFLERAQPSKIILSRFTPYPGCLPSKSRIVCREGVKEIEKVSIGEQVLTTHGYKPVIQTFHRIYIGDIVRIIPWNLSIPVDLTPEHPVLVLNIDHCTVKGNEHSYCKPTCTQFVRTYTQTYKGKAFRCVSHCRKSKWSSYEFNWMTAGQIEKAVEEGKTLALVYPTHSRITMTKTINNELLEALGFYVAEGHTHGKYATELTNNNRELLEKMGHHLAEAFHTIGKINPHGNGYRYTISSRALVDFLQQLGNGAKNKRLPMWLMELPSEDQSHFLKGYLNGDGTIHRNAKEYFSSSPTLAHQVVQLILRQGSIPTLHFRSRRGGFGDTESYTIGQSRANQRVWFHDKFAILPIRKVEHRKYSGTVYNLAVDQINNYLTESFIVHNCDVWAKPEKYGVAWIDPDFSHYWNFPHSTTVTYLDAVHDFEDVGRCQMCKKMNRRYEQLHKLLWSGEWNERRRITLIS